MFSERDANNTFKILTDLSLFKDTDTSEMLDMECMFFYRQDLTEETLGCPCALNVGSAKNLRQTFARCEAIEKITLIGGTKNCTNLYYTFGYCTALRIIEGTITITEECTNVQYAFYFARNLEEVRFDEICVRSNYLSFQQSSKLSLDSLLSILNALSDNSELDTTYTVHLGSANLAKLTDEQKAIAYLKNIDLD
jgi:hypothetical protein